MKSNKVANKLQIDTVIKNLEKRNMKGYYCEDRETACQLVLSMIKDKSIVCWGGSVTLGEIKIKEKLAERDLEISSTLTQLMILLNPLSEGEKDFYPTIFL
ncbi:MAG: LUD domain-containing protein [Anaerovoracaceae bacterium]